jgi:hypothetical protein
LNWGARRSADSSPRSAAHRLKPGRHRPSACEMQGAKAGYLQIRIPVGAGTCDDVPAQERSIGGGGPAIKTRGGSRSGGAGQQRTLRGGARSGCAHWIPAPSTSTRAGAIAACRRHADLQSAQAAACCPPSADPKPRQQPSTALSLGMDSNGIRTIRILFTTF